GAGLLAFATRAQAVPSFARQTGMNCTACHTVWPTLTPFGRTFKLTGYTMSKSGKKYQFPPPLAGMAQFSFTHTNKEFPPGQAPDDFQANDNVGVPQQLSIFYGGKIYDKLGAFVQGTYDGLEQTFVLDNTDIRLANTGQIWGKSIIYGLDINNGPTIQDVYNSIPAWGYPYASSGIAPTPAAATMIDGTLSQQVGGIGLYAYFNDLIYAGISFYHTTLNGYPVWLGLGTRPDTYVDGLVPYWRFFLQHQWGKHSFEIGHYGMITRAYPEGQSRGNTDLFADIAFDLQYQYISMPHLFTVDGTWIHEIQNWDASFALGNTAHRKDNLDTFRVNCNYAYWSQYGTFGGNVAYFATFGNQDTGLYAPNPVDGSLNGRPNSNGFIIQATYLPPIWERRTKILVQYTIYTNFNGAGTNYDGFGRSAADNNTLYLSVWQMF
ncbi:MAG TPA: hypothetical protein VE082_08730, partial [Desulfobaccales bacterium]|nr:hypothetical protein [Desulfobaccales bacterium]